MLVTNTSSSFFNTRLFREVSNTLSFKFFCSFLGLDKETLRNNICYVYRNFMQSVNLAGF